MKKLVSLILSLTIICSFGGMISFTANAQTTVISYSFEGEWLDSEWVQYNSDAHQEGLLLFSTNKNKDYVTEGSQSFYIYDNVTSGTENYTGVCTPKIDLTGKEGCYQVWFDAQVLEGEVFVQARFYTDDSTYVSKQKRVSANSSMSAYSFSWDTPVGVSFARILILTKNSGTGEAYIDNLKFNKISDLREESAKYQTTLNTQIANAKPGSVIEIPDGTYVDMKINIASSGTASKPITIKAENPGNVVFMLATCFTVSGDYVNIEGLRFEKCTQYNVVKFSADSYYSKLKDCAIYNSNPTGEQQYWVSLQGRGTTISNCFFDTKSSVGQMVSVDKSAANTDIPDDHTIENCYFGNIAYQTENGYEAIRLNTSNCCFSRSNIIVSGCFFYRCNGEAETISVKCCFNTVKNNTFYDNQGGVVLRHGDDNEVYGNLFIGGEETNRVTGVRVIGERHKVHDNYFYNLPSKSTIMILFDGCPYEGIENYWYYPVVDAQVYNNTVIGGNIALQVGAYSPNENNPSSNRIVAPDGVVSNNAFVSYSGTSSILKNGDENHTVEFSNNYAYGKKNSYNPEGLTNGYFKLVKDGNYYKPEDNTIGADLNEVKKAPTSPYSILSSWIKETYFDSGVTSFNVVDEDPFNDTDAHINNVIAFDITYGVESGKGKLTLKKDGTAVSETKVSVTGNPELVFTATPGTEEKIGSWYVNNVKVNENNINTLGVSLSSVTADTLTVNDITQKYDVRVEFKDIPKIPESLTSPLSVFSGSGSETLVVKNHEGRNVEINGCYAAIGAKIPIVETFTITEYGMIVSKDGKNYPVKAEALSDLTNDGAFGILFHGFKPNKTYYVKPYAIYYDSANSTYKTVEGSVRSFKVSK